MGLGGWWCLGWITDLAHVVRKVRRGFFQVAFSTCVHTCAQVIDFFNIHDILS